jgi:hypothetical protein
MLTTPLHPKLLWPEPIISFEYSLISGLEAVLYHLIHVRELDTEDLRQDLPCSFQLHCPPVLHRHLLWPE